MLKKKCLKCENEFVAIFNNRGGNEQVYCGGKCRMAAAGLRNYHRRNTTREDQKNSDLKKNYGITLKVYNNIIELQNKRCYICDNETKLYVDHCHTSGRIRGLLCNTCNLGLGAFKDSIANLEKAISYLEKEPYAHGKIRVKSKEIENGRI